MTTSPGDRWVRLIRGFEKIVILALIGLLMLLVTIGTAQLGWLLLSDLRTLRQLLLDADEMLDLFGHFLLVLIGLELITSLKSYIREGSAHLEVVLEVALIAVAQKIILLDKSRATGANLLGQAALVAALAAAFWLAHRRKAAQS